MNALSYQTYFFIVNNNIKKDQKGANEVFTYHEIHRYNKYISDLI